MLFRRFCVTLQFENYHTTTLSQKQFITWLASCQFQTGAQRIYMCFTQNQNMPTTENVKTTNKEETKTNSPTKLTITNLQRN